MSATPEHVQAFNDSDGPSRFGGLHFDDPSFVPGEAQAMYTPEVKKPQLSKDGVLEIADLVVWLEKQTWSDFAQSLAEQALNRGAGSLSEKQLIAARSMKAKVEARQAERNRPDPNGLDLTELPSGLYAVPGGDTRLKVRVNHVTSGKWEGFTFVDDGAEYGFQTKYGMQRPEGTYKGKIEDQLRAILADVPAAQKRYAEITGRCYACNRKLEDELSVELGIGPICRSKS